MNIIMYFSADWCKPCQQMKPMIEDFIRDNVNPKIFKIDSEIEPELVDKFQIRGIPTFVLLNGEKELKRHTGTMTREQFDDFAKYEETVQDDV